ncbi:MAG: DUF2958 domain-containing protein [Anaerolineae bacterium]|jgi:hypothetical protein
MKEKTTTRTLPDRWTVEDVQYLLEKLDDGPILVSGHELGLPTIHDFADGVVHLGFGLFEVRAPAYTLGFSGGGAMDRTPSGQGWSPLRIEGEYAYDFDGVRETLQGYLDNGAGEAEAEVETRTLTFGDDGQRVYFEGDLYLLTNPYLEHDGQRYGVGWVWFQRNPADSVPDWRCVPDPEAGEDSCIGAFDLDEAVAYAERILDLRFELVGAPDDLPNSYPLHSMWEEHQADKGEVEVEAEVEDEDEPGPAGYVAGKGSAYDYIPAWMDIPGLYTTEKQDNPLAITKWFTPDNSWSWYVTEYDGEDTAFGLVIGFETELGYFSVSEIKRARGPMGMPIERDKWFRPTPIKQLAEYRAKWGSGGPYKGQPDPPVTSPNPPPGGKVKEARPEAQVPAESPDPPAWTLTRLRYQESKALTAGGVPILNAADGREHERLVREAVERGEDVPDHVLTDYPDLVKTHYRHPHDSSVTLCSRPIGDRTRVSHGDAEVDCGECLCYARRGYDMHGKKVSLSGPRPSESDGPAVEPDEARLERVQKVDIVENVSPVCDNSRLQGDGRGIRLGPTCHDNEAVRIVTVYYDKDEVESDTFSLCDECYRRLRKDARSHRYRIKSKKLSVAGKKRGKAARKPKATRPVPQVTTDAVRSAQPAPAPETPRELVPISEWDKSWETRSPLPDTPCARCGRSPAAEDETGWYWACGGQGVYSCPDCLAELSAWKEQRIQAAIEENRQRDREMRRARRQAKTASVAVELNLADWEPDPEDQAEFERWDLELLTGRLKGKSSPFYRALSQVARPGTLRLALLQVNGSQGERRRQELIEKRLAAMLKQQTEPEETGASND